MSRYDLLMAGQAVRGIDTSGVPIWMMKERTDWGIPAYTIYRGGKVVRSHAHKLLPQETVQDWCSTQDRIECDPEYRRLHMWETRKEWLRKQKEMRP